MATNEFEQLQTLRQDAINSGEHTGTIGITLTTGMENAFGVEAITSTQLM